MEWEQAQQVCSLPYNSVGAIESPVSPEWLLSLAPEFQCLAISQSAIFV